MRTLRQQVLLNITQKVPVPLACFGIDTRPPPLPSLPNFSWLYDMPSMLQNRRRWSMRPPPLLPEHVAELLLPGARAIAPFALAPEPSLHPPYTLANADYLSYRARDAFCTRKMETNAPGKEPSKACAIRLFDRDSRNEPGILP